jgi:plasmid stability protein
MAAVSIRGLDEHVRERLRVRAARHGRSMEAEMRVILEEAVSEPTTSGGLFNMLLDRFGDLGGVELDLPPRTTPARPADLPT